MDIPKNKIKAHYEDIINLSIRIITWDLKYQLVLQKKVVTFTLTHVELLLVMFRKGTWYI